MPVNFAEMNPVYRIYHPETGYANYLLRPSSRYQTSVLWCANGDFSCYFGEKSGFSIVSVLFGGFCYHGVITYLLILILKYALYCPQCCNSLLTVISSSTIEFTSSINDLFHSSLSAGLKLLNRILKSS